jgi:superfamily II DNA or RNA helicase
MNESKVDDLDKLNISKRKSWFEKGKSFGYISSYFEEAKKEIRIASGFFTMRGWGLLRKFTKNKQVYLLVGLDDPGEDRARKALIDEIMRDLRTGLDRERRQTVFDLVEKMKAGRFHLVDARATDHHAKLYIVDCTVAIITSSNLTESGLKKRIEDGNIMDDKSEVVKLAKEFDDYFAQAVDITRELLEALQRWLLLVRPWDIYLKTMLALEDLQPIKVNYKKQPVSYQVDMIAQTLRQLREFRGSMLVASTGLGKTVVAVHVALHLRQEDEIQNVMVVGPKAVRENWEDEMLNAGLPCVYFVRQTLDKSSSAHDNQLTRFEKIVANSHEQSWLLIIDESHQFRNRYQQDLFNLKKQPAEAKAFARLKTLFQSHLNLKVLLLTGSPYAKDIDNINSQLFLLPHTSENRVLLPEFVDDACSWHINKIDEFIDLDVASQLTTPHVAKHYGQVEGKEIFINFGEEKRYIPKLRLHSISFPLFLEKELTSAINEGYFELAANPMLRKSIERVVKVAWASSPLALRGAIERVMNTPKGVNGYNLGKSHFKFPQEQRQQVLVPILEKLLLESFSSDIKLQALCHILRTLELKKEKAIVFCERRATVVYLKQALNELIPSLRVAATINERESDYQLKETEEIEKLIKRFAPLANDAVVEDKENYDIFLSTDAHGVGVNMQDASVVINYDIDWTPIGPIQRAGRVLRFCNYPRLVEVYTFVPTLVKQTNIKYELLNINQRWENLINRHGESKKLIDLPVLTISNTQEIDMPDIASQVKIQSAQLDIDDLADLDISPYYQHTAKLQLHRDYAKSIPSDIISTKITQERSHSIYVLLNYGGKYHGLIYKPETQHLHEPTVVKLLDLIACEEDTETASVDYDYIEELSNDCILAWCNKQGIKSEDVVRECALYFKPVDEGDRFGEWLNTQH